MALPVIYHAHPTTGMFLVQGQADPDPLEPGNWLIPAHAYVDAPPELAADQVAVRAPNGLSWVVAPVATEAGYYTATGEYYLFEPGVEPPPSAPQTLEMQQKDKREIIDVWRQQREQAGLPYSFPGGFEDVVQMRDERDRTNINAQVTIAMLLQGQGVSDPVLPFRAASNTTYLLTPTQMIEMGMAVAAFSSELYQIGWALKAQVDEATSAEELEAIVWPTN